MFGLLKSPLERRLFALIWPRLEDLRLAIPDGLEVMLPAIPLRATTAIPNLAIAAALISDYYFQPEQVQAAAAMILRRVKTETVTVGIEALAFDLQRKKVQALAAKIEALLFERIAADETQYKVSSVLMLGEEQSAWNSEMLAFGALGCEPSGCSSNLDTILRVVHATRIDRYQELCRKGVMFGFVARRWMSEITGRPEAGFEDLGCTGSYFSIIHKAIAEEMKR